LAMKIVHAGRSPRPSSPRTMHSSGKCLPGVDSSCLRPRGAVHRTGGRIRASSADPTRSPPHSWAAGTPGHPGQRHHRSIRRIANTGRRTLPVLRSSVKRRR
jgi:hypothetical protein